MNGTELIELLAKNIGGIATAVGPIAGAVFTAIFLRHDTSAKEFEKVKAGKLGEVAEDLLKSGKMTYTEFYKANNFLKVVKKADEIYPAKALVKQNLKYNFDWFIRFYEAVGNVSDEEMQNLWAKILSGEIEAPSTYSLKIIDVLKNLRKEEAELFAKICAHSFSSGTSNTFLPNYGPYLEKRGITYVDIMRLSEEGLIFNDSTLVCRFRINPEPRIAFTNRELLMKIASSNATTIEARIKQYPFTMVGRELAMLVEESASDDDFMEFGKILNDEKNYAIGVHRIIAYNGDYVEYDEENLIQNSTNPIAVEL